MIRALNDFILIEKTSNFDKHDNLNIIIPEMNEAKNYGIIHDVGDSVKRDLYGEIVGGFKIGDKVYFNPFNSAELKHEDKVYYIVKEFDLMVVIYDGEK